MLDTKGVCGDNNVTRLLYHHHPQEEKEGYIYFSFNSVFIVVVVDRCFVFVCSFYLLTV
jgi:hypothetical protein